MTMTDTVLVPLTQGKFAVIDAADADDILRFRWCFDKGYATRKRQAWETPGSRLIAMHRQILGIQNAGRWVLGDHRDGERLNNRRSNLRRVTAKENASNKASQRGSSSPFLGVGWHVRLKRWEAAISNGGKRYWLGYYADAEEAARAYDRAARRAYGEFARTNFPT
jgi:hypothetical protein